MPYRNPGTAANDALTQFLAEREATRRQHLLDEVTLRREQRQAQQDADEAEYRKMDLKFRQEQLKDATEARKNTAEEKKAKTILDNSQKGDIYDADTVALLERQGLGSRIVQQPTGGVESMTPNPVLRLPPVAGEPTAPPEAPVPPVSIQGINRGTPEELKTDEHKKALTAYRDTLSSEDPVRKAIDFMVGTGAQPSAGVVGMMKPGGAGDSITGPEEDQRYENIIAKASMQQSVTPEDMAWARAYEKRKLLGPSLSAGAADTRLASTQEFQEQEAGRTRLQTDIEKPYRDAHAQADTLRDVVSAAQQGNKLAGSLQSLEATMAAIRAQGLNRINMPEIGMSASAGSAWDRIQGWLGKAESGQPVPPDVQKDMIAFADILDKAAYKKYKEGHTTVTRRYKLTDETPLPPPAPTSAPGTGLPPGVTVRRRN